TKEELMKEMPKEVSERLAELELKKEEMEKVSQVFKTVMIAPVIPPQLCDNTIPDEEDCAFGLVFSTGEE
ncbi:7697_t:CDS:2, partial [Gigaspora rosea]